MRHEHSEMIIEWAETSKQVQRYCRIHEEWEDDDMPTWSPFRQYRFKPVVIRYRRYIYTHPDKPAHNIVGVANEVDDDTPYMPKPTFVCWIDNDWQEVEI